MTHFENERFGKHCTRIRTVRPDASGSAEDLMGVIAKTFKANNYQDGEGRKGTFRLAGGTKQWKTSGKNAWQQEIKRPESKAV